MKEGKGSARQTTENVQYITWILLEASDVMNSSYDCSRLFLHSKLEVARKFRDVYNGDDSNASFRPKARSSKHCSRKYTDSGTSTAN